jgi:PAS domain S-box-containing protein
MKLRSMKLRFAAAIAVAYVVIALFTCLVFHLVTSGIVRHLATNFAVKQAQLNRSKLMSAIQHDLALSLRMSESPLLIRWALDEDNPGLKRSALKELESYRASFKGQSLTFIPDRSQHNYFLDGKKGSIPEKPRYTLSPDNLKDSWYFRVLREVDNVELNVDYDETLDMTRVWFNVIVKDGDRKIGVGGSSIDITDFINEIVNTGNQEVETILFSRDGAITGHRDKSYVIGNSRVRGNEKKLTVYDLMGDADSRTALKMAQEALLSGNREVEILNISQGGKRYLAAMSYVREVNWCNLVLVDTASVVSTRDFSPIVVTIIISLLAVLIIIGLMLNKIVLRPLARLTESARQIARGNFDIVVPVSSDDEVGVLSRAFNEMARMVKGHANNLERNVAERTQLFAAINDELLAANEELNARRGEAETTLEALRRSEDQLRLILDSTAEAIYGTDLNGNCTFCNTACVCLLGYAHPDELVGKNMHGQIHYQRKDGAAYPETECPIYRSLWKEEGIHLDDEVFCRADGSCFPVEYWSYPQFRNGEIVGAVVTFMDITDRTLAQEKLLKLSRAVENSPATVVITDRSGRIEYVNPKFTEIAGYLPEEAIGRNPRILNAGVQSKEFYQELWSTITSGNEWRGEFCNKKKNGDIHWEYASISPLRDEKGNITHFVAVKEDITERKRTAEELQAAKDAADAANRAKSQFLANMSHEIRTPLNAIIGFSTLALEGELPPRQHDYVNKISTAAVTLLKIINDILDFSKIEAGKLDMEHTLFRLDDTLANVMTVVQQKASEKGLNLLLQVAPDLPGVLVGDPFRLGQVITNLLGNAVKFTAQGEVALSVTLHGQDDDGVVLLFSVRDTGVGLSPESLVKLFRPFTQADGSTTRRFGGTGLGLSISKQLVEMMDGEIWGESEPGSGSTFRFTARFGIGEAASLPEQIREAVSAPLIPAADDTFAGRTQPAGAASTDYRTLFPCLSGARILVVDDNEVNRQLAGEFLKKAGAVIDTATNGREAFEKVTTGERVYDMVLMDAQMPEMDGYETTRRIRADGRFTHLPIIAMTAHALAEEVRKSRDAGMNDHITKPINVQTMLGTISRHLHRPPAEPSHSPRAQREPVGRVVIPTVEGLDSETALERIDGDRALYLQILAMFAGSQTCSGAAIATALEKEDRTLAERLVHTTRGMAGSIGATALQEMAADLEHAIRRGEPGDVLHAMLQPFGQEVERLVQALGAALPVAEDEAVEIDEGRAATILARLYRYLRENDGMADHYLSECRLELAGFPGDGMARIRSAIAGFDYDAALVALAALSEKMGIDLSHHGEDTQS